MSAQTKAANKAKFQTGDVPTQTDFEDLIDSYQDADADLTAIAALTPTDDDFLQRKAGAWTSRTVADVKTDLAINNVDNTSDSDKPVSTAQQTALNLKVDKETFTSVTFADPLVLNCANKQSPKFKTAATGDFTFDLNNVKSGSDFELLITTATASAILITFDASFTNKLAGLNTVLTTYLLPSGTGKEYLIQAVFDGTTGLWSILDGTSLNTLTGAVTSTPSGVTTIPDDSITVSKLDSSEFVEQIVSDLVVQTALNDATGYTGGIKTGISGLLAGQFWSGTSTDGKNYDYLCVVDGTASRKLLEDTILLQDSSDIDQVLETWETDIPSVSTTPTDLISYTLPAAGTIGNLTVNKQGVKYEGYISFVGHVSNTRVLTISFAGTTVATTGSIITATGVTYKVSCWIVRLSASSVKAISEINGVIYSTTLTSLTLSSTNIFKVTATGVVDNDITSILGDLKFKAKR